MHTGGSSTTEPQLSDVGFGAHEGVDALGLCTAWQAAQPGSRQTPQRGASGAAGQPRRARCGHARAPVRSSHQQGASSPRAAAPHPG